MELRCIARIRSRLSRQMNFCSIVKLPIYPDLDGNNNVRTMRSGQDRIHREKVPRASQVRYPSIVPLAGGDLVVAIQDFINLGARVPNILEY